MNYTIEKGVPIPPRNNSTASFGILDRMEIGDSTLFSSREWKRARNQCYSRKPKVYTFRSEENGYRCWRIA